MPQQEGSSTDSSLASFCGYVVFLAVALLLVAPVGRYLANVFEGKQTWLTPFLQPIERLSYRLAGIDAAGEQDWKSYSRFPLSPWRGAFARQGKRAVTLATLPTDGAMFVGILIATVLLLTLLSFFPALALGPIVEHFRG